ncbi:MAG: gluconolactonase [Gammaproteobacteria bacterium]|jgi:gluconolactonase
MFAPPVEIDALLFARVPDALRRPGVATWMSRSGRIDCFIEGPAFDREGNLYLVDMPAGRILRVDESGRFEVVVEYAGAPNGLAVHADGSVWVADRHNGIVRVDPVRGTWDQVLERLPSQSITGSDTAFKGINDLTFDHDGNLYFTDQGATGLQDPSGRLVRLGAAGEVDVLLDNIPSPNGLVLDSAGRNLYLAVTRANAIWHVPLTADRRAVGRVGLYLQLNGGPGGGPDGLALDASSGLVIAHAQFGSVWVFSALGEPLFRIRVSQGALVTNIAFGGRDGRTLYITESASGSICTARLPHAGLALFSHATD